MINSILTLLFSFTPLYIILILLLTDAKYIDSNWFKTFLAFISIIGVLLGVYFGGKI
jgi:disulfide bond formation protein DsbB